MLKLDIIVLCLMVSFIALLVADAVQLITGGEVSVYTLYAKVGVGIILILTMVIWLFEGHKQPYIPRETYFR